MYAAKDTWHMRRNSFYPYAQEDLSQIEQNRAFGYRPYGSTAVHAQQYAEKMLKDAIQSFDGFPPKTHNINMLMEELELHGIPLDQELYDKGTFLSNLYFDARYPDKGLSDIGEDTAELACEYSLEIVRYYDSFYLDEYGNVLRIPDQDDPPSNGRNGPDGKAGTGKGLLGRPGKKILKWPFR